MKPQIFLISCLLFSLGVQAQQNTLSLDVPDSGAYKLSGATALETGFVDDADSEEKLFSSTLFLQLNMKKKDLNNKESFAKLLLFYDRELTQFDNNKQQGDLRDPMLDVGKQIDILPSSILEKQQLSLVGTIGSSDASRTKTKKGSIALKYQYKLPIQSFTFVQYHRLTRSLYDLKVTDSGSINNPWTYRLLNNAAIPLAAGFSLEATLIYDLNRSFQDVEKDGITTDYKVHYEISENQGLYVGVASVGIATKESDGATNRIRFIDEKKPVTYLGLSATF